MKQRPIIRYRGGKSMLCRKIAKALPPHDIYVEVFCGSCWVLLNKPHSKVEAVNDINHELINMLRCAREHAPEVNRLLEGHVVSADEYKRFRAMPSEYLTDVQRAVRYIYMMNYGFSGKADSPYLVKTNTARPRTIGAIQQTVIAAQERLHDVWIDRASYRRCIARYDGATTVFYLDPPYYGSEDEYGDEFSADDYPKLRDLLQTIKGKFLMTINDAPFTRGMFSGFEISQASTATATWSGEIFVSNYVIPLEVS